MSQSAASSLAMLAMLAGFGVLAVVILAGLIRWVLRLNQIVDRLDAILKELRQARADAHGAQSKEAGSER